MKNRVYNSFVIVLSHLSGEKCTFKKSYWKMYFLILKTIGYLSFPIGFSILFVGKNISLAYRNYYFPMEYYF